MVVQQKHNGKLEISMKYLAIPDVDFSLSQEPMRNSLKLAMLLNTYYFANK